MSVWQLVAVGLVMLLGLVGVLVPGVPGQAIVWAAVLWWALTDMTCGRLGRPDRRDGADAAEPGPETAAATAPPGRVRGASADSDDRRGRGDRGLLRRARGRGILGYVGAIFGAERLRLGSRGAGWASVRSVMRATGYAVLVELFCCLLVAGAWLGAVLWG